MSERLSIAAKLWFLSGMALACLLGLGTTLYYVISDSHRDTMMRLESSARMASAVDTARQTQVHFKKQVQEWKNVLLRGSSPADLSKYWESFQLEETRVLSALDELEVEFAHFEIDTTSIHQARSSIEQLGQSYRDAFASFTSGGHASASTTDALIRGIDRAPTEELGKMAEVILERQGQDLASFQSLSERAQDDSLFILILVAIAFTGLLGGVSLLLIRSILVPLQQTEKYFDEIGAGNLDVTVQVNRPDEIGQLWKNLNHMRERLQRQRNQLRYQNDKMAGLGYMMATIAHEFNNPLWTLDLFMRTLSKRLGQIETSVASFAEPTNHHHDIYERARDLEGKTVIAQTAVDRLKEISGALRSQSRVEPEITEGVDLVELVDECLVVVRGKTKTFEVEYTSDALEPLCCFRSQIGQVITNVLSNAADAVAQEHYRVRGIGGSFIGRLSVKSSNEDRAGLAGICVRIGDNGPGVPIEIRKAIFSEYYTTKAPGHGTGIGLSSSLAIIRNHGGTLKVDACNELGGALFEIWVPLAPPKGYTARDAA